MFRNLSIATSLAIFAGTSAFANPPPGSDTILGSLLSHAAALTASLANVAQNLRHVDGSVVITSITKGADLVDIVDRLARTQPVGAVSRAGVRVSSSVMSPKILDVFKPTQFKLDAATTTAIGALQSGALIGSTGTTGTIETTGLAERVNLASSLTAAEGTLLAERYGTVSGPVVMLNVSSNIGDVDGTVHISLNNTIAQIGTVATTAIGTMESGVLTAALTGNMQGTGNSILDQIASLVGP